MNGRFPITITQEQVALFMEKYKPLADLGLFLIGVKTLQKIAPDLTEAILSSLATATGSSNQKSTGRANKLLEDAHTEPMTLPKPQSAIPTIDAQLVESQKWQRVIPHPSVVVVVGRRGSGKSAQGYKFLELFRHRLTPYVLGLPKDVQRDLPDYIGVIEDLAHAPPKSIILVDEAYLRYHARRSLVSNSIEMSRLLNLSRQREQTLIFISPQARYVDKNIAGSADIVIVKEPEPLQPKFERVELGQIIKTASEEFTRIKGDKRRWSYVYSPAVNFFGLMENDLPSFWTPRLSRAFATAEQAPDKRIPKRMTKQDTITVAKELRRNGLSYRKIGISLGVNEGTAYNYVNNYPYKRNSR